MPDRIDGMDVYGLEEYFRKHNSDAAVGDQEPGKDADLPEAPKFPLDALPEPIRDLAVAGAKSISCPEDYVACAALGVAAGAIGSTRVARIKNSWQEPPILYLGLCGPSGDGKTPAETEASLPIHDKQKAFFSAYEEARKRYEEEMREYKVEEVAARKEGRAADAPPEKPIFRSVFVQDTTPEALAKNLYVMPRGLLRIEDELAAMIQSFDQYKAAGKGRERGMWLQIWSAAPYKVDRKSDETSFYVPRPHVSLIGNIQPRLLPNLLAFGEADHDGFAARILFTYPEPVPVKWTDDDISEEVRGNYKALLDDLYELKPGVNPTTYEDDETVPRQVRFTDEARKRFAEYFDETSQEMQEPGFDPRLSYPWSKFRGYCARLALVLAMCRTVTTKASEEVIELEDVNNAVALMDYFKAMARRIYASLYGNRPEDRLAHDVVVWLKTLPNHSFYGRPEEGFEAMRKASREAPASANWLCRKLVEISTEHPVLVFEHGFEATEEKARYWSLSLRPEDDPDGGGGTPGPKEPLSPAPESSTTPSKNGVRSVRSVRDFAIQNFPVQNHDVDVDVYQEQTSSKSARRTKTKAVVITREGFIEANEALAKNHNLIWRDEDLLSVRAWLKTLKGVSVDIETYGPTARLKEEHKKEALSFVRGKIRLITLSSGDKTYFLDAMFLSKDGIASVLEMLRGKALYAHNGVFDLPRLLRHFGVNLCDKSDIRDTLVLSRLVRSGEWVWDETRKSRMRPYEHDIRSALINEGVAEIDKETDHRWGVPLNKERLLYARDDVIQLQELHHRLMKLVAERDLGEGLTLFMGVYPAYMRMQYQGVPFDAEKFGVFREKLDARISGILAVLEEHKPDHPEGLAWSWGNKNPVNKKDPSVGQGRNGARRALAEVGIVLTNLKKETRQEFLRENPDHPSIALLEAYDEYCKYTDLRSDCKDWLEYHYEDGRIYPNVHPFSQVTGRSAFRGPPIQNTPKERDEHLGYSLRDLVRVSEDRRIVKCDYSSQELRILAEVADDEDLVAAFTGDKDPHLLVGEKIVGKELTRDTVEGELYRDLGKRANYGFAFGAGPATYARSVFEDTAERISEAQARAEQRAFRESWKKVYAWQKKFGSREGEDEEHWYTVSFVGRRRYVARSTGGRSRGKPKYTDRCNGPIQASGADMLYVAVKKMLADQENGLYSDVRILFTTHDEIVLEAPVEVAESAKKWLETCMREAAGRFLRPELAGSDCAKGKMGLSWGGN
jgi:hypothetical protein